MHAERGEREEAEHKAGHADLQELADEGDVAKLLATAREVAAWLVSHCLWCNSKIKDKYFNNLLESTTLLEPVNSTWPLG